MAQINLLTVSVPVTEFQMTPAASLPLHKSGKLVLKKHCLCGAEIIQKCKCKILAKAGEMDEHSLELLAASYQVIIFMDNNYRYQVI